MAAKIGSGFGTGREQWCVYIYILPPLLKKLIDQVNIYIYISIDRHIYPTI